MAFSDSGRFFAVYLQSSKILNIFDSQDLDKLYDDINEQQSLMHVELDDDFGFGTRIAFDTEDKYIVVASKTHVMAYSLQDDERKFGKLKEKYIIDPDTYDSILDLQVTSKGMKDDENFKLFVACQVTGVLNVHVFDLNKQENMFAIAHSKESKNLKVKISRDCKGAILSNGLEHYMHDGESQANFP